MAKLVVDLTPDKNGGESVLFSVEYPEPDSPIEEISLNSYGSIATITTSGVFTSDKLFDLAKKVALLEEGVRG